MKQKLIAFSKVILLYFIIVFSSCENENITTENSNPSISNAKSWFDEFKAKENFQPIFKDLTYNWQNATITTLTNGEHAIAVPVLLPNQSQEYYGHKIMYLYPKNKGTAYDVSLFEFIPNPNKVKIKQDTVDLIAFDGYIINWDLINGFVRGSKFERNVAVNDINLKVIYSKKNNTHKEGEIIALEEVVVYGKPNSNSGGSFTLVIYGTYTPLGIGTNSGIYVNTPYGGGGKGDSKTELAFVLDLLTKKVDPKEQLKCFNKALGATLTIYVQQPNENTEDIVGSNSVGHAFIGIEQNGIVRQLGFYPTQSSNSALVAVGTTYESEIRSNYDYLYHVSISKNISSTELNSIITYIENYPKNYNVNSYSCADFAITVGNKGGIPLKSTTVSSFTYSGRSPGKLGQEIRSMTSTNSITVNKSSAKSPVSKGVCK
jgi:hypothetical protein